MEIDITEENTKIVPPLVALWTKVKEGRENTIKAYEESLIIEKAFLELAEDKIKASL